MYPSSDHSKCALQFSEDDLLRRCLFFEKQNELRKSIGSIRLASHIGTVVVSTIAVIINVVFLVLIAIGFKRKTLISKRYLFFAGRSLIDLLVAGYSIVFISTKYKDCKSISIDGACHSKSSIFWGMEVFQVLITLDCLVISAIYSSVAALTYIAVKRPLHYQLFARSRIVLCWLAGIFIISLLISVLLVVFVYGTAPNGIVQLLASNSALDNTENFGYQMLTANDYDNVAFLVGPAIAFLIAIGSYGYIVIFLLTQTTFNARRQKPSVWRLGVNILLFTVSTALLAVLSLGVFHMARPTLEQADKLRGQALLDLYSDIETYTLIETIATFGWFARMTADPLYNMFLDSLFFSFITNLLCFQCCGVRSDRSRFDQRNRSQSTQLTHCSHKVSHISPV